MNAAKVVIVTGGAQGIGKGIVRALLENGTGVVLADVNAEAAYDTARELGHPAALLVVPADVSDETSVGNLVAKTLECFGRLDGLVNNAGIAAPVSGPVENLSLENWNRVLGVNLTGMFLCAKHTVPALRETHGAIVNIASTRALQSEPHTEAYAASKGGVVALTHALAASLGPAIRVNCISPGWIVTSPQAVASLRPVDHAQHPCGRAGQPEDIAALVTFLLSEKAGFITGQNFVVDGGMTRKMIYAE